MFRVFNCLTVEHDWRLVLLAVLICFLTSLAAINLFHRARAATGRVQLAWLATAGITTGCGIWATHFIAMLAYEPGIPVAYNVGLTALSLLAAAAVTSIGFAVSLAIPGLGAALVGGVVVGAGVGAMHYTGMWALAIANAAVAVLGMSLAGAFADRRLRQKDAQLTTALNNMAQGLLMFDPQKRLILCNSRYVEMYGLSPHVVKPGCTIEDLLRHHKEVGTLSEDVEQYCAILDAAIAEGKTISTMESTANERTIHTVSRPMADGGWVTTHEDVT